MFHIILAFIFLLSEMIVPKYTLQVYFGEVIVDPDLMKHLVQRLFLQKFEQLLSSIVKDHNIYI